MAERIQLKRTKGWRKPEGAIVVARPTKWGNPWRIEHDGAAKIVEVYRTYITEMPWNEDLRAALPELRGHDLACWCPLDQPCHADVLLELANA